jgi:hypothetical protein
MLLKLRIRKLSLLTAMKQLKNFFYSVLVLLVLGYFTFKVFKRALTDYFLKSSGIVTKALVIDEENYPPNQSVKPVITYSYEFIVNGTRYINNSHDPQVRPGDTVEVEYVKNWPSLNRPIHPKD